jgi:hypothetical protein
MEIAGQQDRGGATATVIREGVDHRQKISLTDAEMNDGLKRLAAAKLIQSDGDRYFIANSVVPSLPRTASGQLSFRRHDWDKLRHRPFEMQDTHNTSLDRSGD